MLDVRDEAAVRDAFADVVGSHGRLDSVVHCAGVAGGGPVHLVDEPRVGPGHRHQPEGHLPRRQARVAPHAGRDRGSIVNIASIEGIEGTEGGSAYNASKGGVVMLTKCMAIDYGHRGIRVNCICPGGVDTPLLRDIIDAPGIEIYRDKMHDRHLLGRFGRPVRDRRGRRLPGVRRRLVHDRAGHGGRRRVHRRLPGRAPRADGSWCDHHRCPRPMPPARCAN